MRDIGLARRQFFGGLGILTLSAAIAFAVLLPQYRTYQNYRQMENTPTQYRPAALQAVPSIVPNQPDSWKKNVLLKFEALGPKTKTVINTVQGDYQKAQPAEVFPDAIKKVPLTIIANGSYKTLQALVAEIPKQFTLVRITSVNFKNSDKADLKPNQSPILEALIKLDLYVYLP